MPSGLDVSASFEQAQDGRDTLTVPHLHLVLVALEDDVAQGPRGCLLKLLTVTLQKGDQLLDAMQVKDLQRRPGFLLYFISVLHNCSFLLSWDNLTKTYTVYYVVIGVYLIDCQHASTPQGLFCWFTILLASALLKH